MKKIIFYFILFISFTSYCQSDYYIKGKDTVFCSNLGYEKTAQSYLKSVSYTDLKGKNKTIEGEARLWNISTFYIRGITTDKIPQKTNKPEGYIKWADRIVDGKLKINYYYNEMTTSKATTSVTKFFIKMPDGTFYDINKSGDRKKFIIPYLQKCDAFNSAYKGTFKSDRENFTKMIELYNKLCI